MKLTDIIVSDAIVPELQAKTRDEAIAELVEKLADAGVVSKKSIGELTDAVLAREAKATTGIGKGVALPHVKLASIAKPVGTIGRSSEGLDFKSLDGKPVHAVILLLSCEDSPDVHLEAMETIFRHVQRDIFRKFLRQAETVEAVVDLLNEADEQQ